MSYILDALKKSEQQRQRSAAQITLAPAPETPAPVRSRFYRNGALALSLIGAGIALGWLRPWQTPAPIVPTPAPPLVPMPESTPAPAARVPMPNPVARAPAPASAVPSIAASPVAPPAVMPPPPPARMAPVSEAPVPVLAEPQATEPALRVMTLSELPASVRQELPALAISLHAYAREPKDRIVMINNQMLRQGDQVAPGLRLEQITQDGVVLGYQGYRFHRGVR